MQTKLNADNEATEKTDVQVYLHPVLKPFLGFVKLRLQYDETHVSKKFLLVEGSHNKLINTTIEGSYRWLLPVIKEYRIEKAIVYFEDFFQFFSFALPLSAGSRFYTGPVNSPQKLSKHFPAKRRTPTRELKRLNVWKENISTIKTLRE